MLHSDCFYDLFLLPYFCRLHKAAFLLTVRNYHVNYLYVNKSQFGESRRSGILRDGG